MRMVSSDFVSPDCRLMAGKRWTKPLSSSRLTLPHD